LSVNKSRDAFDANAGGWRDRGERDRGQRRVSARATDLTQVNFNVFCGW
jgi:hypothetical protein